MTLFEILYNEQHKLNKSDVINIFLQHTSYCPSAKLYNKPKIRGRSMEPSINHLEELCLFNVSLVVRQAELSFV
jgi:hypothetical protein